MRRDGPDGRGETRVRLPVDRPVADARACRVLAEEIVAPPIPRRPDRPWCEASAAIGADVLQHFIDAGGAERALVAADPRLERIGRQRVVAVLTGRSEFEHGTPRVA